MNDYRTTMECLLQILPKVAIPLLVFMINKLKGTQMGLKYCDKCEVAVDQAVLECPDCGHKKFVPGTVIWKRDTPKPSAPKVTTPSTSRIAADLSSTSQPNLMDSAPPGPQRPTPNVTGEFSKTGKTIDDLIRAQNRTTHAVRAFVRFLFIQLTGITLVVFLWNLSLTLIDEQDCFQSGDNCTGNTSIQLLAGIIWIATVIWSSYAGWEELNKSNVD